MKLPKDLHLWTCICGAANSPRITRCPKCAKLRSKETEKKDGH
jgi:ribosomal protein L40E